MLDGCGEDIGLTGVGVLGLDSAFRNPQSEFEMDHQTNHKKMLIFNYVSLSHAGSFSKPLFL